MPSGQPVQSWPYADQPFDFIGSLNHEDYVDSKGSQITKGLRVSHSKFGSGSISGFCRASAIDLPEVIVQFDSNKRLRIACREVTII